MNLYYYHTKVVYVHESLLILVMSVGILWVGHTMCFPYANTHVTANTRNLSILAVHSIIYVRHEVPKFKPVICLVRLALADSELWSG